MGAVEARLALEFWQEGQRQRRCQACGWKPGSGDGPWLEVDHAIPKSVLKRLFRQVGEVAPLTVLWDVRNARLLCSEPAPKRCHGRWTNRVIAPPPIREAVREFARELDERHGGGAEPFSAWLEDTYPVESEAA